LWKKNITADADKLWVCSIDTGSGELVQILTGAQNVVQGAVVPVAVVGSELPNGMKLKKAKMRGLESFGMLCSASELGLDAKLLLPSQRDGILLLAEDTPIGLDIKDVLGLNDVIFDFDLTANRGDCFNMLGLAREVAAITGVRLNLPDFTVREEAEGSAESMAMVEIQDSALCSRFSARVLKDIEIKESPAWMQNRLRACGIRPISNVVDVTKLCNAGTRSAYACLRLRQGCRAQAHRAKSGYR
jgi:phenylalanyl-tRNA synthetase beta chain